MILFYTRERIWCQQTFLLFSLLVISKCTAKSICSRLQSDFALPSDPEPSACCLSNDRGNFGKSGGPSSISICPIPSQHSCRYSNIGPWYETYRVWAMAEDSSVPNSSNEKAIVLYSPPILEQFHRSARSFHLADREFTIKQNWEDFGVAAVVWDAALVLCEYLESETKSERLSLEGKRIIELGAGTGLVGMVASHLKGHLTITDKASTLKPLRANVKFNFPSLSSSSPKSSLPSQPPSSSSLPQLSTATLNSSPPSVENSDLKQTSPSLPIVKVLEWGEDLHRFPIPFDVILGADIIYIEETFVKLLQTLVHLSNESTLILLSCRIRYERDNRFLDMMKERFHVEHVFHDGDRGIEIYSAVNAPIL